MVRVTVAPRGAAPRETGICLGAAVVDLPGGPWGCAHVPRDFPQLDPATRCAQMATSPNTFELESIS